MNTVRQLFAAAVDVDPTRPLLTFYDDLTGERTELSGATLANWVAKTANLVVDGVGLGPGDGALVLLPPHWQTAAVLLGCWSAGLTVLPADTRPETSRRSRSSAGGASDAVGSTADVAFVAADRTDEVTVGERYALGLHPFGLPLRGVPAGYADYSVEVRGHGDRFEPATPADDQEPLCAQAAQRASILGIGAGERVLIDAGTHPDPVDWLLAPLSARASLVLCGHLDSDRLAARVQAERVNRVI
ncbi:acyl-CoA synthetase [Rugosimonospora africana]|uniref:Acyl-CoA synthetase n=1 Tax=Rugosimonospora africana TaxID=556532 RepID=A0A8J3QMZ9_9ACTN|nr:acyl-CoA synthetase [Rugosimonospora africana]